MSASLAIGSDREPPAAKHGFSYQKIDWTPLNRGAVTGIVATGQRTNGDPTVIPPSLQGLTPGASCVVVGSSRSCSKTDTKATSTYAVKIKDAEGSSLFDESAGSVVGYTAPSSVRVFEKPASGPLVQKGCGLVEVYDND